LLAINQHDNVTHAQAGAGQFFDRFDFRFAGRRQIVNHDDGFSRRKRAFDGRARAVLFCLAARIDERTIHLQRDRGRNRQRSVRNARQPIKFEWAQHARVRARHALQNDGMRNELPQVEVNRRARTGFQGEIAKTHTPRREQIARDNRYGRR